MTHDLKFGWLSPVIGNAGSDHQSIVLYQQEHILPTALPYFDSLWIADHFYGFDARTDLSLKPGPPSPGWAPSFPMSPCVTTSSATAIDHLPSRRRWRQRCRP